MVEWISAGANVGMLVVTIILAMIASKALGQIEEMKTQNKNDAVDQLYTRMFEIQKLMIEHPKSLEYLLDTKHGVQGIIILEMYADFIEQIVLQLDLLPDDVKTVWKSYVNKLVNDYPALARYIKTNNESLTKKIEKISESIKNHKEAK